MISDQNNIKNAFFCIENNNFLLTLLQKKYSNVHNIEKSLIFKLQNDIYTTFIESVYNNTIDISSESIENVLISLNKMLFLQVEKTLSNPESKQVDCSNNSTHTEKHETSHIQQPVHNTQGIQTDDALEYSTESYFHIFSSDCSVSDSIYTYNNINLNKTTLVSFEIYNNFFNINEDNNEFELVENSTNTRVFLPVGNYDIFTLVKVIAKQLNEKTRQKLNDGDVYDAYIEKSSNRVVFSSPKVFGIKFVDKNSYVPQLRQILGFKNISYINNKTYTTDSNIGKALQVFDDIYVSFTDQYLNNYKTSNGGFSYFTRLSFNSIKTYGENVSFVIDDNLKSSTNLSFSFFIYTGTRFQKINKHISFSFILKLISS